MSAQDPSESSRFPLTRNETVTQPENWNSPKVKIHRGRRPTSPIVIGLKWFGFIGIAIFLVIAGSVTRDYMQNPFVNAGLRQIVSHPGEFLRHPTDILASLKPEFTMPPDKQHIVTVLLLGCDADYAPGGRPLVVKDGHSRSDAIMIARIDFDKQSIHVMSIPRDTAVNVPDHRGVQKINAAHAFGGPELTQRTIKETFGIDTDYFVTLDFVGFQKVVDAIGGVDLMVHKRLKYNDNWGNLHINLYPGFQHMDGYKAMGYVRIRHSDNDMMRAERQQEFLDAMRSRVKQPETFLKLPNALDAITDSIHTNMSHEQLLTIANFSRQIPKENIRLVTLPVVESKSYVYTNVSEAEKIIRDTFFEGSSIPFSINVPDRTMMTAMRRRDHTSRRSHRHHAVPENVPKDDDGNPLIEEINPVDLDSAPEKTSEKSIETPKSTPSEKSDGDTKKPEEKGETKPSGGDSAPVDPSPGNGIG